MSSVTFHTINCFADAKLCGPERAYAGHVCGQMLVHALGVDVDRRTFHDTPSHLRRLLPADHYVLTSTNFYDAFETHCRVGGDAEIGHDEHRISVFLAGINTAIVAGSDPIRLLARLHGQCEVHGYVEQHNRKWLAGIVRQGLDVRILRDDQGWLDVAALLENIADAPGPVVTSYSVCDSFPDQPRGWVGEDDDWYELPFTKQWELAMTAIRLQYGLEWKPEQWDLRFGNGITGYDLRAQATRAL